MVGYLVKGHDSVDFNISANGTCQEIRQILKAKLPDYAIPSYYVEIPELPINPQSGKTNKKMLPPPPYQAKEKPSPLPTPDQIPENISLKETLDITRKIWSQILDHEESHIFDDSNFFDIGGHSLFAVQATV